MTTTSVPSSLACNCSLAVSSSNPYTVPSALEIDIQGIADVTNRFHLATLFFEPHVYTVVA